MAEHTLITPRRNFLIRALGFTAAGAILPITIITADDAKARIGSREGVARLLCGTRRSDVHRPEAARRPRWRPGRR